MMRVLPQKRKGTEIMMESSRRGFLKGASATAAVLAVAKGLPVLAEGTAAAGPVQVWSTFRDRRHASEPAANWKPATQIASNAIMLDPTATRQEILGFGAALTDASCWVLSQIPDAPRAELMHEIFSPDEMAFNVCRTCIGSSDYSRSVYSFDESAEPDPGLTKFSIDHDRAYILPTLRAARALNPDLFLFSSAWSPPGWMKFNNSMLGGTIRKSSLEPYSRFFKMFLDGYKAEGVLVNAVTVNNEVDTTVDGRYPACLWAQEDEILFVSKYLGPLLRMAGSETKIWILDHNFNLWGRVIGELSNPLLYEYAEGVAWHGYAGEPTGMTLVHDAFPEKSTYFTEGGPLRTPGTRPTDPMTNWAVWGEWANSVMRNWARSITVWNLALDEHGTPYIGHRDPAEGPPSHRLGGQGVITVWNDTHKVERSGRFWAFAHYSKHVRRGAKVFGTNGAGEYLAQTPQGTQNPVSHVGFRNPDGSLVVVLVNTGQAARAQLVLGTNALDIDLAADSMYTLQWS
ncbi:MAG: glycoside hydrolase family 30 beta sandwich domain-containing protein [Terracidiphilus sp.]